MASQQSLYDVDLGALTEFLRRLDKAGMGALVGAVNKQPELASIMVAAARQHSVVLPMFRQPPEILDALQVYATSQRWPLGQEMFCEMAGHIPASQDMSPDRVIALDIWLGDLKTTFLALYEWARHEQLKHGGQNFSIVRHLIPKPRHLRLLDPTRYGTRPSLGWIVVDMQANVEKCPVDVRNAKTSAGLQVLSVFGAHPSYLQSLNGGNIPFVWLPGLEFNDRCYNDWHGVPFVSVHSWGPELNVSSYGNSSTHMSAPTFWDL